MDWNVWTNSSGFIIKAVLKNKELWDPGGLIITCIVIGANSNQCNCNDLLFHNFFFISSKIFAGMLKFLHLYVPNMVQYYFLEHVSNVTLPTEQNFREWRSIHLYTQQSILFYGIHVLSQKSIYDSFSWISHSFF